MLVSFSIKPGDETDQTEPPNLLTKQNWTVSTKLFFLQNFTLTQLSLRLGLGTLASLSRFRPLTRVLLTDLNQQEIKELLAGFYSFSTEVLPSQNVK